MGNFSKSPMLHLPPIISASRNSTCDFDLPNEQPCTSEFREPTGRCSNIATGIKTWGMVGTPYTRILAAKYQDGTGEKRTTEFSGGPLRSAREICTVVMTNKVVLNRAGFNAQIMQWGQYIAHEFTQLGEEDSHVECCPDARWANKFTTVPTDAQLEQMREEIRRDHGKVCQEIEVNEDSAHGGYLCMNHVRSRPAPLHNCAIGPRQQMNGITHVFDGSAIYGSTQAEQDKLREHAGGLMKTQLVNGRRLPPADLEKCPSKQRCPFLGGDTRINTTPNLAAVHTVALVKHNQFAAELAGINPHWDDERLFQEVRRIVYSVEAKFHYYEYLPLIIGDSLMSHYKLNNYTGHEPTTNPSVLSEMAGAAFRFGHSTVDGFYSLVKDNGDSSFINLRPQFFNNTLTYEDGVAPNIRGMAKDIPWIVDRNFPNQMRDFMFDAKLDIVSFNINRGRDHGYPSYVEYRKHYGLSFPLTWDDLSATHPVVVVNALKQVYTQVTDIELYPGGVTENHAPGALVGDLFGNIIGDGFARLQRGDMFYFESAHSGLTAAQIQAIKDYKYSQFLCEGAGVDIISDNAFVQPPLLGSKDTLCSAFKKLDLNLWKETDSPTPVCEWQITDTGECCSGERKIIRRCVGDADCKCEGPADITESCPCDGWRCHTNWRCYASRWRNFQLH